jgi:hypothetical protein
MQLKRLVDCRDHRMFRLATQHIDRAYSLKHGSAPCRLGKGAAAAVLEIPIKSAVVSAEGDVDLRGTLGVTEGVPVGFKEIRLRFEIETDAPQIRLDQLLELTDRYCVVFQTIQNSPKTKVQLSRTRN